MSKQEQLTPATAIDLAAWVEYSPGSVVSKTLVNKKAGTLTLFSFDADQGLSEHSAPFDALVQVLDGEVEITLGGKPVRAKAGQIVLMPANVPHSLQAVTRFKMLLTMIR
ncbi:MAG: cupin domain-containing protein [Dehalococcoidia bacterium]